jgi:tetratricopeptide (TPR) repeat protein
MYKKLIIVFTVCILFCKHSFSQTTVNPEAVRLNQLAFTEFANSPKHLEAKTLDAIALFDKAIIIDSTFFIAYYNKFSFQRKLKYYKEAMVTGKQIMKLHKAAAEVIVSIGQVCEQVDDEKAAVPYYEQALSLYQATLDTMNISDIHYRRLKYDMGVDLVMLNRQNEAFKIFKDLYDTEREELPGKMYLAAMNNNRSDFIYGKGRRKI